MAEKRIFIKRLHYATVDFDPSDGHLEPTLTHFLSTIAEPLKTALPLLIGREEEHVLILSSPLSEIVDDAIRVYRHDAFPDRPVVDQQHRAFFEAIKASLAQAMGKLDQLEFAALDEDDDAE